MNLIGWLVCKWKGKHKRGKRLFPSSLPAEGLQGKDVFRCERCGHEWTRKARKA